VELSEHFLLGPVKQLAQIQASGIGRSGHAARAYRVSRFTGSTQPRTSFKGSAIQLAWRTHSCVPRRDSSRRQPGSRQSCLSPFSAASCILLDGLCSQPAYRAATVMERCLSGLKLGTDANSLAPLDHQYASTAWSVLRIRQLICAQACEQIPVHRRLWPILS
jgi:hypothetical protein